MTNSEIELNPDDVIIQTITTTGFIYKELGVKVTHIKTGLSCECRKHKSMHKNRAEALSDLLSELNKGKDQ